METPNEALSEWLVKDATILINKRINEIHSYRTMQVIADRLRLRWAGRHAAQALTGRANAHASFRG